jgi:predicted phosphoribosyltransferase
MFSDRAEAGEQLAGKLEHYRGQDAVVLALPRGGIVVGHKVARALSLPLDIVVTRKIGHPGNPEYAVCAVDEHGALLCNEAEASLLDKAWLQKKAKEEQEEAQRRSIIYRRGREPIDLANKVAIIVDDGIATGLTMRLAIVATMAQHPKKVIVAVPVAASDAAQMIKREADEVIILEPSEEFAGSVGLHYEQFEQIEDAEVIRLLRSMKQ